MSDLVIAEAGAKFGFTETRLGILPAVISPFVIAKIGETNARALFPGGRRFDATRALRIGLVHEVVEGDDALDRAVDAAVADLWLPVRPRPGQPRPIIREVRGLPHASTRWHTARRIAAPARERRRARRACAPSSRSGRRPGRRRRPDETPTYRRDQLPISSAMTRRPSAGRHRMRQTRQSRSVDHGDRAR